MKLFRNKDFRRALVWHIAAGATLTAAGALVSPVCAAMLFAASVLFTVLHAVFTARRYRNIAALCDEIDRILHAQQPLLTMRQDEGELSVLINEIQKMTLRLKEQTDRLQQEKQHLKIAIEDIFHQLRTPLTAMEISVSLLREETLSDERRIQLARELHTQLSRTASLIETLLKLSKIDAGAVQFRSDETSVRDVVERAAEPFGIAMELRGQKLQLSIGDEHFCGDLLWTTEAVGNLIKNCVEHTPDGGEITVTAKETALFTQIEIADIGEGFAPEDIPYLFDRFYKGKNATPQSIGIGLSLSQAIVTAQNGTIRAANRPDGGAVFTIKFYKTVV